MPNIPQNGKDRTYPLMLCSQYERIRAWQTTRGAQADHEGNLCHVWRDVQFPCEEARSREAVRASGKNVLAIVSGKTRQTHETRGVSALPARVPPPAPCRIWRGGEGVTEAHCPDPRCECPDVRCSICCWCTCPPGWLTMNFGYHRGPKACPQYDIDQHQRALRDRPPPAPDAPRSASA